jgi:hypothetical protein
MSDVILHEGEEEDARDEEADNRDEPDTKARVSDRRRGGDDGHDFEKERRSDARSVQR